jgi:hypothetical protein
LTTELRTKAKPSVTAIGDRRTVHGAPAFVVIRFAGETQQMVDRVRRAGANAKRSRLQIKLAAI